MMTNLASPSSDLSVLFDNIANDLRSSGFSVCPNALPDHLCLNLRQTLLSLDKSAFKKAGVGREVQHTRNADLRRDEISWIEQSEGPEGQWLEFSALLQQHLNRKLMLGLFSFESHFAHYAPGAFYKTHVDAFRGQANRMLSVVLYLNPNWSEDEGGEMVLYQETEPQEKLFTVKPELGTLAVFLSEEFPHEVLPAKRDRYSIAGWYRVNSSSSTRVDPPA
jgi:SM-20-related protein